MNNLKKHIRKHSKNNFDKIVEILVEESHLIVQLGISMAEIEDKDRLPGLICEMMAKESNRDTTDEMLQYLISEYLIEDDEMPLIKHWVSADNYSKTTALFVFQFGELFICCSYNDEAHTTITADPEMFCEESIQDIMANYELEKENLQDDWFAESNPTNELIVNFDFN